MSLRFRKELYLTSSLACLAALAIPAVAVAEDASPPPVSTAQAQTAQAQTAGNGGIGEIVVTANKRSQSINKVGMEIKALGGAELQQQNVTTLADLARAVPGLTYTNSEYGTPVYTLRGIGFYETSLAAYPDVSVYLDQAPLPFPVDTELTLFDVERVEVLEGPQGTLFGNNATGGAINYIANKPTPNFDAGADVSYGNYNTFQADGFVSGPITDKVRARFAFSTTEGDGWQHSDAQPLNPAILAVMQKNWPTVPTTPNNQAGNINGAQDKAAVRFIVDWTPTDDLNVEWNLNGWHDGSQPQQPQLVGFKPQFGPAAGQTLVPGQIGKVAPGTFASYAPFYNLAYSPFSNEPRAPNDATVADWPASPGFAPESDNYLVQSTLRVDYDLTDSIKLTSITNYVDYSANYRQEGAGSQWTDSEEAQIRGYANTVSQELRVANTDSGRDRWVAGLNYEYDTVYERDEQTYNESPAAHNYGNAVDSLPVLLGLNTVNGIPVSGNSQDSRQNMSNYAVFANNEYDILDQVTLKGGVRFTQANRSDDACYTYSRGTTYDGFNGQPDSLMRFIQEAIPLFSTGHLGQLLGDDHCFGENATTHVQEPRYTNRLDQDNVSWHGGVDWKPADNILAFANVSRGFKAGSFPTLPGTTDASQEPVTQEYLTDFEVGTKSQFFDRHLSIDATAFYYDYKDKQLKGRLHDPTFGVLNALVNIPKSTVDGAELAVHVRPITGLDIGAQATYLEAQITKFTGFNAAGIDSNYDHTQVPYTPKWALQGSVSYEHPINDRLIGFTGAQVNYRSSTTTAIGSPAFYSIPAYGTLDLQAGVETSDYKWRFFLWGKNVTNSFYLTNIPELEDSIVRYTGMPVTFGATISYRY